MQLYASRNIHFLYIITFVDPLLEWLQECPTLKKLTSLEIGLKRIISVYNQGHIIRELRTRDVMTICRFTFTESIRDIFCDRTKIFFTPSSHGHILLYRKYP